MNRLRVFLGGLLWAAAPFQAVARIQEGPSKFYSALIVVLPLALIITLLIAPALYRKKLGQRKQKSLRHFIMTDPRFQDSFLSKETLEMKQREGEDSAGHDDDAQS